MGWHYQIRRRKTPYEIIFDIVEVFRINGKRVWTEESIAPISTDGGKEGMIKVLEMIVKDAKHYPVLHDKSERGKP